eukprot:302603-Pleurochrysis_carterae.AAC.9
MNVVYFCTVAPRAHCGKVVQAHSSRDRRSATAGMSQIGPCRLCKKRGDAKCPLSEGCSRRYSAPASRAARTRDTVRCTSRFACSSSRRCEGGTLASPMMFVRSRTGGGPPSCTSAAKNLLTEKRRSGLTRSDPTGGSKRNRARGRGVPLLRAPGGCRSCRPPIRPGVGTPRHRPAACTGPKREGGRSERREPTSRRLAQQRALAQDTQQPWWDALEEVPAADRVRRQRRQRPQA